MGSSPRVRGRQKRQERRRVRPGLIPAGAGQTAAVQAKELSEQGSSPRVRGRRAEAGGSEAREGLIPAGAGQTIRTRTAVSRRAAHPRGCGADRTRPRSRWFRRGSSPRVRGRLTTIGEMEDAIGLIPAGAGQTGTRRRPGRRWRAHPRGCGADANVLDWTQRFAGSSPRVRGRH